METKAGIITKFEPMDVIAVNGTDYLVDGSVNNLNTMLELTRNGALAETLASGTVSLSRLDHPYGNLHIDHLALFSQLPVDLSEVR